MNTLIFLFLNLYFFFGDCETRDTMIKVLFFAQVRELTGTDRLELENRYSTVEELRDALSQRGERWALALDHKKLLFAANHTFVQSDHPLTAGDEIAFFPPVTGG